MIRDNRDSIFLKNNKFNIFFFTTRSLFYKKKNKILILYILNNLNIISQIKIF